MQPEPVRPEPMLRLRPLGLGDILDDIFRVYRRHFALLAGISIAVLLPTLLLQVASGQANALGTIAGVFTNLGNPAAFAAQPPPAPPNFVLYGLSLVVTIVLVPFSSGAVTQAAIDLAVGNPVGFRSVLRAVLRRYWALLGLIGLVLVALLGLLGVATGVTTLLVILFRSTAAVVVLVITVAVIATLVVLAWFGVRWTLAVPALLAEGAGPVGALRRSWRLTRGSYWRTLGIIVLVYILQSVVGSVVSLFVFPLAILVPFVPGAVRGAILLTGTTLAGAVTAPVVYLCVVLLYFDLRIRRESFDLDQLARQAVEAPNAHPEST